jgi:hypothetical protein
MRMHAVMQPFNGCPAVWLVPVRRSQGAGERCIDARLALDNVRRWIVGSRAGELRTVGRVRYRLARLRYQGPTVVTTAPTHRTRMVMIAAKNGERQFRSLRCETGAGLGWLTGFTFCFDPAKRSPVC